MVGIKRSSKLATDNFSYGFGKERFFWALISACGIFFLGAGITLYHGVELLITPHALHVSQFTFIILLISFIVESLTFFIAVRELRSSSPHSSWRSLLKHGDPVTLAVVYEDGVACFGVLVAVGSLLMYKATGNVLWDGIGSVIV